MNLKRYLKKQDGILVADAIVAILILVLFSGIIVSLITGIVLETKKIEINSQQIDFATKILEHTEKMPYADVTEEKLNEYVNNINETYISTDKQVPYMAKIKVEQYNQTEDNEDKLDLIKIVTVSIESVFGKTYKTEIKSLKKANINEIAEKVENVN